MNKPLFTSSYVLGLTFAMASPMSALAQPQEVAHSSTVSSTAHELGREEETITATVVQVDQQSRLVTLRGANGKEQTIEAGPEVQNLDQLKPGDQVNAHYQAAAALEILPAGSAKAGKEVESGMSTAAKGEEPGGMAGHSVTVTSKLTAIDMKNHTVTLTGADGKQRIIEVKNPERQAQMSKLKVGDMVRITYVEALAITVTPKAKVKK